MRITKYGHACIVLEEQGQKLVIDPGGWTGDFGPLEAISTAVITHNHADHFDATQLQKIIQANPGVQIYGAEEVAAEGKDLHILPVNGGQDAESGPFHLRFFGEMHALIHQSFPPVPHNVGVLVNDMFYDPGDSFTVPLGTAVKALAVPVSAPWLKMSEVVDFVQAVRPKQCIATHNALLSEIGQGLADHWLEAACKATGARYTSLKIGESLDI